MQNYPLVTISIINFNDRKFIFKAIESIVNQNYPNLEVIITDNNSTDGTREEIERKICKWEKGRRRVYKKLHADTASNQIRYIKNTENIGFGRSHNQAVRLASGDFILLLNSLKLLMLAREPYLAKILEPSSTLWKPDLKVERKLF